MHRRLALILVAIVIGYLCGCSLPSTSGLLGVAGSGVTASRTFDLKDFTEVDVSGPFEVAIDQGEKFDVTVTSDDNLQEFIVVEKTARKLAIHIQSGQTLRPKAAMKAKVTMPVVEAVDLEGACIGSLNGFKKLKSLKVVVQGASKVGGDVQSETLTLEANGASEIKLAGKVHDCAASAQGASRLQLGDLTAEDLTVNLNGASNAVVHAEETLDFDLNGASHLDYKGDAKIGKKEAHGASGASKK
jgi:hypothetical protein